MQLQLWVRPGGHRAVLTNGPAFVTSIVEKKNRNTALMQCPITFINGVFAALTVEPQHVAIVNTFQ